MVLEAEERAREKDELRKKAADEFARVCYLVCEFGLDSDEEREVGLAPEDQRFNVMKLLNTMDPQGPTE